MPSKLARLVCAALALASAGCNTDPGEPPRVGEPAVRLEKAGGDRQAGVVGQVLPNEIEVRVVDPEGHPVGGREVNFEVYSGGGNVTPMIAYSDQHGIARTRWTLGTNPASAHQVSVRVLKTTSGALMDLVTFVATAEAGVATSIAKESGDLQAGPAGGTLPSPLTVLVRDQFGNAKPTTTVNWTVLSGGGTPSSASTWTDGAGRARIQFTLGSEPGTHRIRASIVSGQSVTFTLTVFERTSLEGVVERSDPLSSRPYAAAISSQDVVYITQLDNQRLSRINLPTLGEAGSARVGSIPTDVSFNPAGTRAYVANQHNQSISVVDVPSNAEVARLTVPGDPFEVIADASDARLYVVTNTNRLYQLERATGTLLGSVSLPGTGQSLAFHPNGYLLYVSTFSGGSAYEVDTRSMTVTRVFSTGGLAQEVVVSGDGAELFVADQTLQKVDVFSLGTGARLASIPVGGNAWGMAITPDQRHLYVSLIFQGQLAVIERGSRTVVQRITTGGMPRRIVFNQSGTIGVVPNEHGFVTYIR